MKVYILIDWDNAFVIGVYQSEAEAKQDQQLVKNVITTIVERDLIK